MLTPIRARRAEYEEGVRRVYEILRQGTEKAIEASNETLRKVKEAMRINYFEDKELIKSQV